MEKIFGAEKSTNVIILFLVIVAISILLRTYHHDDWLRFNADQSRDASVVSDYVSGQSSLPLFGPKAGGTEFRLGGMFYYFQILSAKIFGDYPDKMAYPDLLAGILTIVLLFLLARLYFKLPTALILAFIASISIFLIKYARFAWNPNSGPFFTLSFLYGLLLIMQSEGWKKNGGAIMAGLALGIGVQLHTMLLIIMPATAVLFFIYCGVKYNPSLWRQAGMVLILVLLLNSGQIMGDYQAHGSNIRAFFGGTSLKTAKGGTLPEDVLSNTLCQLQANLFIVSAIGDDDQCGTGFVSNAFQKSHNTYDKSLFIGTILLSGLFTFGGVWLWIRSIKKTTDPRKKLFLQLIGTYSLMGFLLLIPLAHEISLRFYLALVPLPFVILGLWIEASFEWQSPFSRYAEILCGALLVLFIITNGMAIQNAYADYRGQDLLSGSTKAEITLGEIEFITNYMLSHAQAKQIVWVEGKQEYLFKYLKSFEYFTRVKGLRLFPLSKDTVPGPESLVVAIGNAKNRGSLSAKLAEMYTGYDAQTYARFSIVELVKK